MLAWSVFFRTQGDSAKRGLLPALPPREGLEPNVDVRGTVLCNIMEQ